MLTLVKDKPVISLRHLSKSFDRVQALDDVSAELMPGHIIGLLGENGCGKTTLLRSLAKILASGEPAVRVSVIDTRGELGYSLGEHDLCVDILSGYPKHTGISIAARTLSPQVIICDEIGSRAEAEAICEAQGCGVPLIATAHASSVRELLGRSGMGILHRSGCFLNYVGISRSGEFGLSYDVCKRGDADIAYL